MKEETLNRIEAEITSGDLGKARDRLHGLLGSYPDDLALRQRLGDVYWQLQYPAMAGRYWYLEEEKSAEMADACRAFVTSCGDDPVQMLLALKFRGDAAALGDTFAGLTLLGLQQRAVKERNCTIDASQRGKKKFRYTSQGWLSGRWLFAGCVASSVILLVLAAIGLVALFQWIF